MNHTIKASCIVLAGVLALGCGSDPKPEPETPNTGGGAVTTTPAPKGDGSGDTAPVGIEDKIAKMCDLPEARFDFNSASVSSSARSVLDKLAECFLTGKGKGKNMNIVGHADERGETEYNFALGQRRAGSIADYLAKKGLKEDRVATSSRGELEATGTDKSGWARDRKVEILLAE
jgi:peptidoglycan-associated lipoprotein